MNRLFAFAIIALAAAVTFAGCGDDDDDSVSPVRGRMDLSRDEPSFTIALRPGDLQGGAPSSISSGDFNADGVVDLLLGAPFADPEGTRTDAGEAMILYGPVDGDRDLADEPPDVRIIGASPGDMLGAGVAAGDLNADGIDDVVLGAPGSNGLPEVRTDMGEAYVLFGGNLPASLDLRERGYDFLLQPAEGFSTLGKAFALADVNADGTADLVAGAPYAGRAEGTPPGSPRTTVGEVYVVYGSRELTGTVTVAEADEDVRLSGINTYDQFGASVAAGDTNGDNIADIVVGASGFDGSTGDTPEAGGVFVFYGGPSLPKHRTLGEADVVVTGQDGGDTLGTIVAAGDLNGDGKAEIVASAPSSGGPGNQRFGSGEVAVVDLAAFSGPDLRAVSSADARRIYAPTDGELLSGPIVLSPGERPRLAIGSILRATPERLGAGWTYVLPPPTTSDTDLASENSGALQIEGASDRDGFGGALAYIDLDGDGSQELLAEAAGGVQLLGAAPTFVGHLYVLRLP